jgi:tRNA (guanine-N(7)-)-methyltransferase
VASTRMCTLSPTVVPKVAIDDCQVIQWLCDYAVPLEVEIGFGRSRLLIDLADRNPGRYYVGVEIDRSPFLSLKHRIKYSTLTNIGCVHLDGRDFLRILTPSGRLSCVHLYFPTPYPRESQIFDESFVVELCRVLEPGGGVRVITDVESYFDKIQELMSKRCWYLASWSKLLLDVAPEFLVGTPCETAFGSRYVLQAYKK